MSTDMLEAPVSPTAIRPDCNHLCFRHFAHVDCSYCFQSGMIPPLQPCRDAEPWSARAQSCDCLETVGSVATRDQLSMIPLGHVQRSVELSSKFEISPAVGHD